MAADNIEGRATEALTVVRGSATKTDVKNLYKRFGYHDNCEELLSRHYMVLPCRTFAGIVSASKAEMLQIYGIGESKAQVLDRCFNEKF